MSYQLNETVHNTQWVTGHFHLIFGGAIVIMYFMVAYELWPQLTRSAPLPAAWLRLQLWLWFIGHARASLPWHWSACSASRGGWRISTTAIRARAAGVDRDDVDLRRADPGRLGAALRRHPRARALQARRAGRRSPSAWPRIPGCGRRSR
jgi:hypothetical protein